MIFLQSHRQLLNGNRTNNRNDNLEYQQMQIRSKQSEAGRRKLFLSVVCGLLSVVGFAQTDSVYRIGLILPFKAESSSSVMDGFLNAHDFFTASKVQLSSDVLVSLEFYHGLEQALNQSKYNFKIELSVYDNWNNDSITEEILKKEELKQLQIIIGSYTTSSAKLVADFCNLNHIINIQPFSPSKSLTGSNPYHLKLAPTIDAHADAMFNSVVDSFPGANVIIYTPDVERSSSVAYRFDSLFRLYNQTAARKFTVNVINSKDTLINGKKPSVRDKLKADRKNILIITSFDEAFINGNLRVLFDQRLEYMIIVYGMPTWLSGDILRLDYLNEFSTHISDHYYADSSKSETLNFMTDFRNNYNVTPGEFSFLGYDLMNFTLSALSDYGLDFMNHISTQRFTGTGYKFDIVKVMKDSATVNYLENRHVNIFRIENYRLRKVY